MASSCRTDIGRGGLPTKSPLRVDLNWPVFLEPRESGLQFLDVADCLGKEVEVHHAALSGCLLDGSVSGAGPHNSVRAATIATDGLGPSITARLYSHFGNRMANCLLSLNSILLLIVA